MLLGCVLNSQSQDLVEFQKVVGSDRVLGDRLGMSVAIDGDYIIAGSYFEQTDAAGANPLTDAGGAFMYEKVGATWSQVQKLVPSDREAGDYFGHVVEVEGDYAFVGAHQEDHDAAGLNFASLAGSVYVFQRIAGVWTEVQKLVPTLRGVSDRFGFDLSASGNFLVIGAYGENSDVNELNHIGGTGSCYIFENIAGTWTQVQKIVASDREFAAFFGYAVDIDGNQLVVGAHQESKDANGLNPLTQSGAAYVFERIAGTWTEVAKLVGADREIQDYAGWDVAISGDALIMSCRLEQHDEFGAGTAMFEASSAYVFEKVAGTWTQVKKLVASDRADFANYGFKVEMSGDWIIIGAKQESLDENGLNSVFWTGTAYIARRIGGVWNEAQKLARANRNFADFFGWSVAIEEGGYAVIGAPWEDEDELEANTVDDAGSVYIYTSPTLLPVTWLTFDATPVSNAVEVTWSTQNEVQNAYFTVERSSNGIDFSPLGEVPGSGNSSEILHYSYTDIAPLPGGSYYRLKQVDTDGKTTYSSIKSVEFTSQKGITIGPNPMQELIYIRSTSELKDAEVTITTADGQLVAEYQLNGDQMELDSPLIPGIYLVSIRQPHAVQTFRLVKTEGINLPSNQTCHS